MRRQQGQPDRKTALVTGAAIGFGAGPGAPITPENRACFTAAVALGRLCGRADVADVAGYPASDAAAILAGVDMPVEDGRAI